MLTLFRVLMGIPMNRHDLMKKQVDSVNILNQDSRHQDAQHSPYQNDLFQIGLNICIIIRSYLKTLTPYSSAKECHAWLKVIQYRKN